MKYIFAFYTIILHQNGSGSLQSPLMKDTDQSNMVDILVDSDLVRQGARASAAILL